MHWNPMIQASSGALRYDRGRSSREPFEFLGEVILIVISTLQRRTQHIATVGTDQVKISADEAMKPRIFFRRNTKPRDKAAFQELVIPAYGMNGNATSRLADLPQRGPYNRIGDVSCGAADPGKNLLPALHRKMWIRKLSRIARGDVSCAYPLKIVQ